MNVNAGESYTPTSKFLHWVGALCFIAALLLGIYFWTLVEGVPEDSKSFFKWIPWHKSLGFTVFLLLLARIPWRWLNPPPPLPDTMAPWERTASHIVHYLLYAMMVAIPLSGWLGSALGHYTFNFLGLIPMPNVPEKNAELANWIYDYIHIPLAWAAAALLFVHVGAALKHHFITRDAVLTRMLPGKGS